MLIGVCLWSIGLPNPVLWGILAALMRFVPFIGTFIAVVPPLLLAIAVVPGWSLALLVLALFVGCELVMGQVIEPLIYGHSTGLSPIAVIVATAFWAFLWGPVGLLLATPLTVCLVVIGRHVEPLAFLDVILGDTPPLEPAETFYQRALEGNARDACPGRACRSRPRRWTEYYDKVALRGLALAQGDLSRDALAFERLEAIHSQIERCCRPRPGPPHQRRPAPPCPLAGETTVPSSASRDAASSTTWPPRWRCRCCAQPGSAPRCSRTWCWVLAARPGARRPARLCCLSVLEEGSTVSGIRYFMRRMQKQMPEARSSSASGMPPADSPLLADLRSDRAGRAPRAFDRGACGADPGDLRPPGKDRHLAGAGKTAASIGRGSAPSPARGYSSSGHRVTGKSGLQLRAGPC